MVSVMSLLLLLAVHIVFSQPTIERQHNDMCQGYHMVRNQISDVMALLQGTSYCKSDTPVFQLKGMMINSPSLGFSYILMKDKKNWDDARKDCLIRGYKLAWIDNMTELNYLVNTFKANPDFRQMGVFLGGTDICHEGHWVWTGPQIKPLGHFTNWREGEPNNGGGAEDCMYMDVPTGKWNDAPCSAEMNYLCKQTLGVQVTYDETTPLCGRK